MNPKFNIFTLWFVLVASAMTTGCQLAQDFKIQEVRSDKLPESSPSEFKAIQCHSDPVAAPPQKFAVPDDKLRILPEKKDSLRASQPKISEIWKPSPPSAETLKKQADYLSTLIRLKSEYPNNPKDFEKARILLKNRLLGM